MTLHEKQLFLHEKDRTEEVLATFEALIQCSYASKNLGASGLEEVMSCDCERQIVDGTNVACNEDSNCINRLTSVECSGNGTCGTNCANQRFQRRQYSRISIFLTEKKGYGVRAMETIEPGQFIYEYIGEVIDEKQFRKRMVQYDMEKIRHFYFMMLQKGEFIDATKRGSLARFCNHSCDPNAYVDKWVVGRKLRMGIFAKRRIEIGEEICFDYNVDRYGANAQKCYCGAEKCIGILGGKTQTDSARLLPQTLADALGISSFVEKEWIKEQKRLKKKVKSSTESAINEEFVSTVEMRPLELYEVPKVMSALMLPNQDVLVIKKLLERIRKSEHTEDSKNISLSLIRLHGYKTLSTILRDMWKKRESEIVMDVVDILLKWPAMSKNKITSSSIEDVVKQIVQDCEGDDQNEVLRKKCLELLGTWSSLQMAYRIRKAEDSDVKVDAGQAFKRRKVDDEDQQISQNGAQNSNGYQRQESPGLEVKNGVSKFSNMATGPSNGSKRDWEMQKLRRIEEEINKQNKRLEEIRLQELAKKKQQVAQIIEEAKRAEETRLKIDAEKQKQKQKQKTKTKVHSAQDLTLEQSTKLWNKAFATVVPNMVRVYEKKIGHDKVKSCAKDIVKILSEKEITRHGVKYLAPKELKPEKVKKVKDFVKEYMKKWMVRWEQKK